jgi:hypothetical protein
MIGPEGAVGAALLPIGGEHEVIDEELVVLTEEVGEGLLAFGGVEDVLLFHLLPGQVAAEPVDRVALAGELLFFGQELLARGHPLLVGDDGVLGGSAVDGDRELGGLLCHGSPWPALRAVPYYDEGEWGGEFGSGIALGRW